MIATKGSQYQLQRWINEKPSELSTLLLCTNQSLLVYSDAIEWVSPLMDEQYKTYQDDFLELLFEGKELELARRKLRQYWPSRGPVWDGLAIVQGKNLDGIPQRGIILIDAKAHVDETKSALRAKSFESREKIISRIVEVKAALRSTSAVEMWTNQYYQIANRLCFLYFLHEQLKIPTWLVFSNFVNDASYKPTTRALWLQQQKVIWRELGVSRDAMLMGRVVTIYPDSLGM